MLAMCNSYFWKLCIENRSISLNYRSISHDVSSMHVPDTLGLCHVYSTFYFPWLQQKMVVGDTLWFKFRPEDGYIVTVQGATDREFRTRLVYVHITCNTDAYMKVACIQHTLWACMHLSLVYCDMVLCIHAPTTPLSVKRYPIKAAFWSAMEGKTM